MLRIGYCALALIVLVLLAGASVATFLALGLRVSARTSGTISGVGVRAPVQIIRDAHDIPHIRAANLHDLFFAQGYAEGSDRLFQMDLTRHFVYGTLSQLLGPSTLRSDEYARIINVRAVIATQWQQLAPQDRAAMQAFSDGINAAMLREPLPFEYRLLFLRPQRWTPQDSLAVAFATILGQTEDFGVVANRAHFSATYGLALLSSVDPLTDPKYDAPTTDGSAAPLRPLEPLKDSRVETLPAVGVVDRVRDGSNEWVAGGARTASGRALLANDPHLPLGIPGIWYLVDLQAPGFHVAGASLAGTPGVDLGHNDRLAWGITNGNTTAYSLYKSPPDAQLIPRSETFAVRFGKSLSKTYFDARDGGFQFFGANGTAYIVYWRAVIHPQSPVGPFFALDRAQSIAQALHAIARYNGPSFNFVFADTSGAAAYHLAGSIPNDPAWARYAHPMSPNPVIYPPLLFAALPTVAPSRSTLAFTSNNRMYGREYRYRLSADFAAPYRAFRIRTLLRKHARYTIAQFARMQMDAYSVPEAELARDVVSAARRRPELVTPALRPLIGALRTWDGNFSGGERGATIANALRIQAETDLYHAHKALRDMPPTAVILLRALRERPIGWVSHNDYDAWLLRQLQLTAIQRRAPTLNAPWRRAGAIRVEHPLAALGLSFLNGSRFAGDGDSFTVHVQSPGFSQSFRAVWEVGNWDEGGITIPQGESGYPGSRHYTDFSTAWVAGRLVAMPYSRTAVAASARATLTLTP